MVEDNLNSAMSSEHLIAQVAKGDKFAFSLLYDRHARLVYVMASYSLDPQEADEALQEIFLRLWDRAIQFDPKRGEFRHWLMAITRNYLRDRIRKRTQHDRIFATDEIYNLLSEVIPDTTINVEEEVMQRERSVVLLKALQHLPDGQRRVIVLAYFDGLSQSAIAEQLNLPLGTVKKRIKLGMEKLRRSVFNLEPKIEEKQSDNDE